MARVSCTVETDLEPNVVWDHNASAETIQKVRQKLAQHKIKAVNYGVVQIPEKEADARTYNRSCE